MTSWCRALLLLCVPLLAGGNCGDDVPDPCDIDADADGDGHDAVACGGLDCDDTDRGRFPGNAEVCDSADRDEDCDLTTFGERDADSDDHLDASCCNVDDDGEAVCGVDCDDTRAGVNPDSPEVCDDFDNDCDAAIDEGVLMAIYEDQDGDGHGAGDPVDGCTLQEGFSFLGNDCDDDNPALQPGAMRCDSTLEYAICESDGEWTESAFCPQQNACVAQPNGTGVCVPGGPA